MLSNLLPGLRDFRTPFITGFLWLLCIWLLFEDLPRVLRENDMAQRIADLQNLVGASLILPLFAFMCYVVGSLLVVNSSPFKYLTVHLRRIVSRWQYRLDEDRSPKTWYKRQVWRSWQRYRWREPIRSWIDRPEDAELTLWIDTRFDLLASEGIVPCIREMGCAEWSGGGLEGLYSVDGLPDYTTDGNGPSRDYLRTSFRYQILSEKSALETRVQLRHPDVYSDIDRLRSEADLRLSIFWPLVAVITVIAFSYSYLALLALLVPILLCRVGLRRKRDSERKLWQILQSGDVSTPTFDAIAEARDRPLKSFTDSAETSSPVSQVAFAGDSAA